MSNYDFPDDVFDLKDEAAVALLLQRIKELEFELERARARAADVSVLPRLLIFSLSVVALLVALYFSISPYVKDVQIGSLKVPTVISYISAFAVLYFAYLSYASFHDLVVTRDYHRALNYSIHDGVFVLSAATAALKRAEEEEVSPAR